LGVIYSDSAVYARRAETYASFLARYQNSSAPHSEGKALLYRSLQKPISRDYFAGSPITFAFNDSMRKKARRLRGFVLYAVNRCCRLCQFVDDIHHISDQTVFRRWFEFPLCIVQIASSLGRDGWSASRRTHPLIAMTRESDPVISSSFNVRIPFPSKRSCGVSNDRPDAAARIERADDLPGKSAMLL
jgi:hypothetical protein